MWLTWNVLYANVQQDHCRLHVQQTLATAAFGIHGCPVDFFHTMTREPTQLTAETENCAVLVEDVSSGSQLLTRHAFVTALHHTRQSRHECKSIQSAKRCAWTSCSKLHAARVVDCSSEILSTWRTTVRRSNPQGIIPVCCISPCTLQAGRNYENEGGLSWHSI